MKNKFTVYGCCVTRDVFNFLDNEIYTPILTIGSAPVTSVYSNGIDVDFEDVKVDANYVNRMIHYNLTSQIIDRIREADSEYFIFDLAEERLPLQDWKLGSNVSATPVTWNIYKLSVSLKKMDKYKDLCISNWRLADMNMELYKQLLERFCDEILKKYSPDKIIYFPLRQIDEILSDDYSIKTFTTNPNEYSEGIESLKMRERQNSIIRKAESIVLDKLQGCWIVPMPENAIGSERHHFGPHPLHFDYTFYEYYAEVIKLIVKDRGEENVDVKATNKIIQFLCRRYEEKINFAKVATNEVGKANIQFIGANEYLRIFEKDTKANLINPITDIAISSMLSEPIKIYKQDSSDLALLSDAKKNTVSTIVHGKTDWAIIDMISECTDKLVVEGCGEIMANYGDEIKDLLISKYPQNLVCVQKYNEQSKEIIVNKVKRFAKLLKDKYKPERIIINEAYYHEKYVDAKGEIKEYGQDILDKNIYLKEIYNLIIELIPGCVVVKMPKGISYSEELPGYKTMEEYSYYQRILELILDGKKAEYQGLINECTHSNK